MLETGAIVEGALSAPLKVESCRCKTLSRQMEGTFAAANTPVFFVFVLFCLFIYLAISNTAFAAENWEAVLQQQK